MASTDNQFATTKHRLPIHPNPPIVANDNNVQGWDRSTNALLFNISFDQTQICMCVM